MNNEITLYDNQHSTVDKLKNAIREGHKRIMLMGATGFGKTRIAAHIIDGAIKKGKKVLFIADLKTLVDQSVCSFWELGIDGSVVMADDIRYAPWKNLQVCSAATLARRKIPDADLVIIDEAHTHYKYLTELMNTWSLVVFIGLSATPFSRGLGKHYTSLVQGPTTAELIETGQLLEPICYGPATINTQGIKTVKGDYDQKELFKRASTSEVTADIVTTYLEKGEGRKFIMFPVNVAHSKDMVNQMNQAGIPCQHIDAYTKDEDRQEAYRMLKDGELMGLSSVGVLSKGFDETSVSCVILAFATKSLIKYIQTVGRGLRAHEGQTDCIILDHGGNVERLGYPDDELPSVLCDGKRTESQKQKDEAEEKAEKELLPRKCPQCDMMVKPQIFTCPKCGHIFAKKSLVKSNEGELVKLERSAASKRNKTTPKEEKQAFYGAAMSHCIKKGYKMGWAANAYRDRFGEWPNAMQKIASDITPEFQNFLTGKNIRYANRRA